MQYYHSELSEHFNDLVMPVINLLCRFNGLTLPGYLENPHSSLISMVRALSTKLDNSSDGQSTSDGHWVMEAPEVGRKIRF
ncbi:MAG: hypothetical protein U0T81_00230 [Saprospiraceae bacterium]